jgi:hypothetical protein
MPAIGDERLTRKDLNGFYKPTADLLLDLQEQGWRLKLGSNGHVVLFAPDGSFTFAAGKSENMFSVISSKARGWQAKNPPTRGPGVVLKGSSEKVQCPRPGCGRWFANFDFLDIHTNVDHEGLVKCPDCVYYGKSDRIVKMHRAREHGYESPSKAARLAAKRLREQQPEPATDETVFNSYVESWQHEELLKQSPIMDKDEILSIEPHKLSYTAESLDLKPVPPAPTTEAKPRQAQPKWEDITASISARSDVLKSLIELYEIAGLEVRLQVRKTS